MISHHNYEAALRVGPSRRVTDKLFFPLRRYFGTFGSCLETARNSPHFVDSAGERLLRVIAREGLFGDIEELTEMYGFPVRAYRALYKLPALEPFTDSVVSDFLLPMATKGRAQRRMLVIVGPRSSGRRRFIAALADLLDNNPEAIPYLQHSEMRANPLTLLYCTWALANAAYVQEHLDTGTVRSVEHYLREILLALQLDKLIDYAHPAFVESCTAHGVEPSFHGMCRFHLGKTNIHCFVRTIARGLGLTDGTANSLGNPDPAVWRHLLELGGLRDPAQAIASYPVNSFQPNSRNGIGYAEVHECQPVNYDRAVLLGASRLQVEPKLRGQFCDANRGLFVAHNAFHNPVEFLEDVRCAHSGFLHCPTETLVGHLKPNEPISHDTLISAAHPLAFDAVIILHDDLAAYDRYSKHLHLPVMPLADDMKVLSFPVPGHR